MPLSPVVQSTQDAIGALRLASQQWGELFRADTSLAAQIDAEADGIARVYEAFGLAYNSLPRFRTEPALRRFNESLHVLERALTALRLPAASPSLAAVKETVARGSELAEAAFAGLGGKVAEPQEAPKPVRGTVQRLLSDRGYGFVRPEGTTTDLFFNTQAVQGARFALLRVGQPVSFRMVPDPRVPGRMQAIEVQPLR